MKPVEYRLTKWIALGSAIATVAAIALSIWPAVMNGFPIVYDDSNIYIAFRANLHAPFPIAYSSVIWILTRLVSLQLIPVIQGLCMVYVLVCSFRVFLQCSLVKAMGLSAILLSFTQLPWLVSWLTTDWLGGCGTLGLIAFWFSRDARSSVPLLAVVLFSATAATANVFVLGFTSISLLVAQYLCHETRQPIQKAFALFSILLAVIVLLFAYNQRANGRATLAVGSSARLFSKLVDKGIAIPYLVEQCGSGNDEACRLSSEVQHFQSREDFLWGAPDRPSLADRDDAWMDRSGKYTSLNSRIMRSDLRATMLAMASDAAALATKLTLSDEGRDLIPHIVPDDAVAWRIRENYPTLVSAFNAARQQQGTLQSRFPATFYAVITILSYFGCFGALMLGWAHRLSKLTVLAAVVIATLVFSTLVHGGLSLPIPRYTVKVSWLAAFVSLVAFVTYLQMSFDMRKMHLLRSQDHRCTLKPEQGGKRLKKQLLKRAFG